MVDALSILYNIYSEFVKFVFDDMVLFDGVSVGWLFFAVFVFILLVRNLLALPASVSFRRKDDEE